ncbi:MAG: DUF5946 family protein [Pseudomonadota bacterium]
MADASQHGTSGCPACGAAEPDDLAACDAIFQKVIARDFSEPQRMPLHRLTVDAYALQHPDRYMRSAKSAAAHLVGACWAIEGNDDPRAAQAISHYLNGNPPLQRPQPDPPPRQRGALTIVDVRDAPDAHEHKRVVLAWARDAWAAWHAHHAQARAWLASAIDRRT